MRTSSASHRAAIEQLESQSSPLIPKSENAQMNQRPQPLEKWLVRVGGAARI